MFTASIPSRSPRLRRPVLAVVLSLLMIVFTLTPAVPQDDAAETAPAIRVEERTVSHGEYERKVNERLQQIQKRLDRMADAHGDTVAEGLRSDTERLRKRIRQQVKQQEVIRLLLQVHAERAGITVSDTDVDARWRTLAKRAGSEEALRRKLEEIDQTPESFRQRLSDQIRIQRFLERNVSEPSVSDTEVETFYRQNEEQLGGRTLEEIRPRIRQQIQRRKQRRATRRLIQSLRDQSDVAVNV